MFYQLFNSKLRYAVCVFMCFAVLMLVVPSVFAIPGTSDDATGVTEVIDAPENTNGVGWIDISATVPDGFKGSVYVQIRNTADDSIYKVESFVLNDFNNTAQVPPGNYVVEVVSTSEDPFLYNVSCDTQEFTLTGTYALHVNVEKNPAGEAFLAGDVEVPETEEEQELEELLTELEDEAEETEEPVPSETEEEPEEVVPEAESEEDVPTEKESSGGGFWKGIIIRVIGILVFGGIFFGIYFFSRRRF